MAHHPEYSYIDPETGNRIWAGPLEITPGDHHHMPQRDASYPSSEYERGHNNASSLGGGNGRDNISAQHRDVNRGAMRAVERGETAALRSGAEISNSLYYQLSISTISLIPLYEVNGASCGHAEYQNTMNQYRQLSMDRLARACHADKREVTIQHQNLNIHIQSPGNAFEVPPPKKSDKYFDKNCSSN